MKWKRSKKAAIEAKKSENNNNHDKDKKDLTQNNSESNQSTKRVMDENTKLGHDPNMAQSEDDVMSGDDDLNMDESDLEDDEIDVADEKQQPISSQLVNPFMDQSNFPPRDMPTDLSMRSSQPGSYISSVQQSQHLTAHV